MNSLEPYMKEEPLSLFEKYLAGGSYMHIISLLGLVTLLVTIVKIIEVFKYKTYDTKKLDIILIMASMSLAMGMYAQIRGIVAALEAIKLAADISPQIVFNGAILSFYAPIWGFTIFMFFLLVWLVVKELIKSKMP